MTSRGTRLGFESQCGSPGLSRLSSACLPHQLVERRDDVIMRGLLNVPPVGVERERDPRMPNLVGDEPNISARAQEMT
jgi:hypothetical protein